MGRPSQKTAPRPPTTPAARRRRFESSSPSAPSEGNGRGAAVNERQAQFGRLVAVRRERLGLSREEVAAEIGVSAAALARIEQGQPAGVEVRSRLAAALREEPGWGSRWSKPPKKPSLNRAAGGARARLRPLGGRRLWAGLAALALALLLAVALVGRPWNAAGETSALRSSSALTPVADYSAALGQAAQREARQERLAENRAAAAAARREEARAAAAAREEEQAAEEAEEAAAIEPVVPAPPAPSGGGGSSKPAKPPDVGHGIGVAE